jgi:hypothetical protein
VYPEHFITALLPDTTYMHALPLVATDIYQSARMEVASIMSIQQQQQQQQQQGGGNYTPPGDNNNPHHQHLANTTYQKKVRDIATAEYHSLRIPRAYVNNFIEGSQELPPFAKAACLKLLPLSPDDKKSSRVQYDPSQPY